MSNEGWDEWLPGMLAYGSIAVEVVVIAFIPWVFVQRKNPGSTIVRIFVLVFFPGIGAVLYLLFGRSRVR